MRTEPDVVRRLLDAHGATRLEQARAVRVRFSSGGLAFRAKGHPTALTDAEAVFVPTRQELTVRGSHPRPWRVTISDGSELKHRLGVLHTGRRLFRWTPEDIGVFAAGALWTYITLPLLVRDATQTSIRSLGRHGEEVVVHLDERIAGHAPRHVLRVDSTGRVTRHDYTATAFGRWAHAAQTIEGYVVADGLGLGTTRRVTPRVGPWRLPWPVLVWIQIHEVVLDPPAQARP